MSVKRRTLVVAASAGTVLFALASIGCSGDASLAPRVPTSSSAGGGGALPIATLPTATIPSIGSGAPPRPSTGQGTTSAPSVGTSGTGGCPMGQAHAAPVTPTVWLVIDGSTSMNEDLGGSSRWDALRSALLDQDGLVTQLQNSVHFGMMLYNGPFPPPIEECYPFEHIKPACGCFFGFENACCTMACGWMPPPMPTVDYCKANLQVVMPAPMNLSAVTMSYPAKPPGGWTPTDQGLKQVVAQLPPQGATDPKNPIYTVLATDGAPNDICQDPMDGGGASGSQPVVAQRVLDTLTEGKQKGMQTFVISLAGDDAELQAHLAKAAEIGKPGQAPFVPANRQQLIDTLNQIIGGATCQVTLDGTVAMGRECEGMVKLNGSPLACGAANGWRLSDPRTVQITGDACKSFLAMDSTVTADFPCTVFRPD